MIAARANQKSAVIFFVKSQQAKSLFLIILKQGNENIALESILPINASRSLTGCMNLELHSVI